MTELRYLSICSGIEAASVAWAPLGWKPLAFAEIEAFPRAVLKHHYPDVPLHGDFTTLRHEPWIVDADVLVGGTPCQGFSVAGLRGSLNDDRSNLALEYIRLADAIDVLRRDAGRSPVICVWENVPGVFSVRDNAFGCFLGGLVGSDAPLVARGGWEDAGVAAGPARVAAWRVLDAQHFGLAQRRRRVFVLSQRHPRGWGCADALLPIIDSLSGHPAPRREAGKRAAGTIAASTGGSDENDARDGRLIAYGGNDTRGAIDVATAVNAHGGPHGRQDFESETFVAHALRADGFDASEDGTGRGTPLVPVYAPDAAATLTGRSSRGRGQTNSPGHNADQQLVVHAFDARQADVLQYGDKTGPLDTDAFSMAICFSAKDHGADAETDLAPTLRAGGHAGSHANAGVMPAIAYGLRSDAHRSGEAKTPSADAEGRVRLRDAGFNPLEEQAPTLDGGTPHAVAYGIGSDAVDRSGEGAAGDAASRAGLNIVDGLQPSLRSRPNNSVATASAVRRLTPVECARLQGFPDDYLSQVTWRGQCPPTDGPMYKALGNSMAVPCMAWIGRRIALVNELPTTDK